MADRPRRAGGRGPPRPDSTQSSTPPPRPHHTGQRTNNEYSNRPLPPDPEGSRDEAEIFGSLDVRGLRPQESRATLNEQFAISRREFEFGNEDEEDDEYLEPAPTTPTQGNYAQDDTESEDEDLSDEAVRKLLLGNEESLDYYTLLGLAREPPPTIAQIRAAYHRLSLAFHPDKHPHHLRDAAQKYFTRLQKAYETLIEPRKRVIYDLEGEEGVQNEYKAGGAMGQGGEAERQIGVKTMNSEEFKKWFMGVLLERERRGIAELIGSTSTCKIPLSAHNLFSGSKRVMTFTPVQNGDLEVLEIPSPTITVQALQLQQSFRVPLPGFGRILQSKLPPWQAILRQDAISKTEAEENIKASWEDSVGPHVPKLTFTANIAGTLEESLMVKVKREDNPNEILPPPIRWYTLNSENVQLSATLEHSFPELAEEDGSRSIASVMQGIDVDVVTGLFPNPTINVGLGRPFTLVEDTQPMYCHFRTFFNQSLWSKPPVLDFRVSRVLGKGHTGYWRWSSGDFGWPTIFSRYDILPLSRAPLWLPRGQLMPTMRIGYLWGEGGASLIQTDEEDDMHTMDANIGSDEQTKTSKDPPKNSSWHVAADSSPYNAKLSVTWGRDLFVRATEYPIRSRIMKSGEAIGRTNHFNVLSGRGVRLEIEGEVGLNSSLGAIVRGVRRIGNFTTIGVGIGVNPQRGLFISLSWSRLNQNIILPVVILSQEQVDLKSLFWALAIPWATYAAVEFVVLRPRLQSQRRKMIEKKRTELRENVSKRKSEAMQALELMRPLVDHRQAIEREQGGLVILRAEYGVRTVGPNSSATWQPGEVADVTVALAALVDGGQLTLPRGLHKSQIIGFWDPAPLKKKHLTVDYLFGGRQHHAEVTRDEALSIPMRAHEL